LILNVIPVTSLYKIIAVMQTARFRLLWYASHWKRLGLRA